MGRKNTRSADTLTYETLPELFTGICDALRTKTGGIDPINHQDIPSVITGLTSGEVIKEYASVSTSLNPSAQLTDITGKKGKLVVTLLVQGGALAEIGLSKNNEAVAAKVGGYYTFPSGTTGKGTLKIWEVDIDTIDTITFTGATSSVNGGMLYSAILI